MLKKGQRVKVISDLYKKEKEINKRNQHSCGVVGTMLMFQNKIVTIAKSYSTSDYGDRWYQIYEDEFQLGWNEWMFCPIQKNTLDIE